MFTRLCAEADLTLHGRAEFGQLSAGLNGHGDLFADPIVLRLVDTQGPTPRLRCDRVTTTARRLRQAPLPDGIQYSSCRRSENRMMTERWPRSSRSCLQGRPGVDVWRALVYIEPGAEGIDAAHSAA